MLVMPVVPARAGLGAHQAAAGNQPVHSRLYTCLQILAVKQALATRARLLAKVAAKQMQHHLIATTGQDPWERHSKRSRH